MITLHSVRDVNQLSLSQYRKALEEGSINVNGRSYSVRVSGNDGAVSFERADLSQASFLSKFFAAVREFFTGEIKLMGNHFTDVKRNYLNKADNIFTSIDNLETPTGIGSQILHNKMASISQRIIDLSEEHDPDSKLKIIQLNDLFEGIIHNYLRATELDKEISTLKLPEIKEVYTDETLNALSDGINKVNEEYASKYSDFVDGNITSKELSDALDISEGKIYHHSKLCECISDLNQVVDGYYLVLGIAGLADGQIHDAFSKDLSESDSKKIINENERLGKNKTPGQIFLSECAKGKGAIVDKLNEKIICTINDLSGSQEPNQNNLKALRELRNNFVISKRLMMSVFDDNDKSTVISHIISVFNDYGFAESIINYSGLGDKIYAVYQEGKGSLFEGLRDGDFDKIKSSLETCDQMIVKILNKASAFIDFQSQLNEAKSLINDCDAYINDNKTGKMLTRVGFYDLYNIYKANVTAPPEYKVLLDKDEQKIVYSFLQYAADVKKLLEHKSLSELKIKASAEDIVALKSELEKETLQLKTMFVQVQEIVKWRNNGTKIFPTKYEIDPTPTQERAAKINGIKENLISIRKTMSHNLVQAIMRGEKLTLLDINASYLTDSSAAFLSAAEQLRKRL